MHSVTELFNLNCGLRLLRGLTQYDCINLFGFRTQVWHGISQKLDTLQVGPIYVITIFIKLLSLNAGSVYHEVATLLGCSYSNGKRRGLVLCSCFASVLVLLLSMKVSC